MSLTKLLAVVPCCAALFGCAAPAPIVFDKPGASQAEFDQALARCDYESSAATQATDTGYNTILFQELDRSVRKRDLAVKCMRAAGFVVRNE